MQHTCSVKLCQDANDRIAATVSQSEKQSSVHWLTSSAWVKKLLSLFLISLCVSSVAPVRRVDTSDTFHYRWGENSENKTRASSTASVPYRYTNCRLCFPYRGPSCEEADSHPDILEENIAQRRWQCPWALEWESPWYNVIRSRYVNFISPEFHLHLDIL